MSYNDKCLKMSLIDFRTIHQPLTDAMDANINNTLANPDSVLFVIITPMIHIHIRDLKTLLPGRWLCGDIIDAALFLICRDSESHFAFSTNFYTWFSTHPDSYNSDFIQSSLKDVDPHRNGHLFEQKLVFFPINVNGNHWTLVAVNMNQKEITYYDSMGGNNQVMIKTHL